MIRILSLGGQRRSGRPRQRPGARPAAAQPQRPSAATASSVAPATVTLSGSGEPIGQVSSSTAAASPTPRRRSTRVELFLLLGVLAGTVLALLAGMAIARRAMAPIAELTSTAAEIARTRDPSLRMPQPEADDEVAELARTLEGMLRELDAARGETESMLARQRRFVADASHELRTPLTSVLANLELLAESLHGDQGEAARSALRSSQRMRRLVADLLLLARTDVGRVVPREPCDLAQIVVEAAAELGPVSARARDLARRRARATVVEGSATSCTGSRSTCSRTRSATRRPARRSACLDRARPMTASAELVVEDDGPGVPEEPRARPVRALRARRRRPWRLLRPGPGDRPGRRRVARRHVTLE